MSYLFLKSGTDVRGTALVTVEHPKYELTDKCVSDISASYILWLSSKTGKEISDLTVSIGHDSRLSGPRIKDAITETISNMGVNLLYCSNCSTPAMFMTTITRGCDGAIQITASHHPYDRNGLKFFTSDGGLSSDELADILVAADNIEIPVSKKGTVTQIDYILEYSKILRDMIKSGVKAEDFEHPLKGFKIAVDAGNGVGGFYASKVLEPLGADISASQFLEPDGLFPNHVPNPENPVAMESIRKATLNGKCDLGVIFDTDVDRASCVDEKGQEINRNSIVALASVIALEGNEGGSIVTDSVTSDGLHDFIENTLGGKHIRFKRGYKNVIDEAVRRNNNGENTPLAIETSGHAAFKENYFLDDGAYLITKIIIKAAQVGKDGGKIGDCIKDLKKPLEEKELRFRILENDFKAFGNKLIESIKKATQLSYDVELAPDNYEGVRVSFNRSDLQGWFLLRLSVHDPVMPFNIESDTKGGCKKIAMAFYEAVNGIKGLDISSLTEYINS